MRKISILIGILILSGCGPSAEQKAEMAKHGGVLPKPKNHIAFEGGYVKDTYTIIVIDGCEYIKGWSGPYEGGPYLTHKGNCNNPIHPYIKLDSIQ